MREKYFWAVMTEWVYSSPIADVQTIFYITSTLLVHGTYKQKEGYLYTMILSGG